jgi:hypothetical protein
MDGHRCHRCGNYWASHGGPPERFEFITHFCPMCLPLMADGRLDLAGPPPPRASQYRNRGHGLVTPVGDTGKLPGRHDVIRTAETARCRA